MSATENRPTRIRWLVFSLGCGTSWMLYLHRYTFALIKPSLAEEWGVDTVQLGVLDSAFSACYMLFQVPCGLLADAIGARYFLSAAIVVWTLALAAHTLAPNPAWMQAARAAFGAGQSGAFAALSRVTRNWFPPSVRTIVQGWIGVFFGRMGGASANLLVLAVMMGMFLLPWRTAVLIVCGAGLLLAVLYFFIVRDTPGQHPGVNRAERQLIEVVSGKGKPPPAGVINMLRGASPRSLLNLFALVVQSILSTIADSVYSNWIPLFLFQVHALKFKEMGVYSMLPLLGGAVGGAIGGTLNDIAIRNLGSRRWARSLVGFSGKGIAGGLIFVAFFVYEDPYAFCWVLFFVKLFGDWSLSTSWGVVTDIGGANPASVFAFNNAVASSGSFLAPVLLGWIALQFGWPAVFTLVGGCYVACATSWLFVNCTIPIGHRS